MFYNGIMLKQGAPKTEPRQEHADKQAESLPSPKQQMDAIVAENTAANAIFNEVGASLREGKLTAEEKAGIVDVLVKQSDERSALTAAKAASLEPAQIRGLFAHSFAEKKFRQWLDYDKQLENEILQPIEVLQPVYNDLAKRLAQAKIEQQPKTPKSSPLEVSEARASQAASKLWKDDEPTIGDIITKSEGRFGFSPLLQQIQTGEKANTGYSSENAKSLLRQSLRDIKRDLKKYLDTVDSSEDKTSELKAGSVKKLIDYLSTNEIDDVDQSELNKLAISVSNLLRSDELRPPQGRSFKSLDLPRIKTMGGIIDGLKKNIPELLRSPFISKRVDVLNYAKVAYGDTDAAERIAGVMGKFKSPSKTVDQAFNSNPSYESSKDSGDPKEESVEIATLSEPYYGMLYKKKYGDFNVETGLWTESDDVEDLQSRPTDEGRHITVTIPNLSRYQILPKPLHDPIPGTQVYFERNENDYEVSSVDPKIDWINTRKVASTEAPKLHYDFSPEKPHSLPAKLTLEEYAKQVKPPSPELREYATSSLPEHAQLFLKGIEALPVADQIKLIEAYSKKYGFYDFDNGDILDQKNSLKSWKDQIEFMQNRLTELSLTQETSGKLYAGVCTDFQTLTSAMLLSKGIKTSVGTGFLVDGTSIKTTDAHALSLVEFPTQNGTNHTFEVDGTPAAGTAGSEKTLASLQRSAFAETLEKTEELLESTQESTDNTESSESSDEWLSPSHAENMINLTFSPAEKQQTRAVLDTIRFSGLLSLSNDQLTDPETTVWLSRSMEVAGETPHPTITETNPSDAELVRNFTKLETDIQQLKPKQRDALKKLLHPILASNLPPKITALFKGL